MKKLPKLKKSCKTSSKTFFSQLNCLKNHPILIKARNNPFPNSLTKSATHFHKKCKISIKASPNYKPSSLLSYLKTFNTLMLNFPIYPTFNGTLSTKPKDSK
jgi:hypothetical protein